MSAPSQPLDDSLYLVLPVPFRSVHGKLLIESQAANGMARWADSFERVTVAAPIVPENLVAHMPGTLWTPAEELEHIERIALQPLPWAYSALPFVQHFSSVRRQIAASITASRHLQFAIGGLLGDWAAVAALEATRQRRRFAIHTDRVEHELMRRATRDASRLRRLRVAVEWPLVRHYHRHVIRNSSLGLWHGEDCFRAYSPWCPESHLIHDIHTKAADLIGSDELSAKLVRVQQNKTLRIVYAGRLDPMKAPLQWLHAIAAAHALGADLQATWYGEGPLREQAEAERRRLGLEHIVDFPGFVAGRSELLEKLRSADLFLYTHITPESPRNLIESMVCGTPLLGYDNAYALDLTREFGGGALAPLHDAQALGEQLAALAADRGRLAQLTREAAQNGTRFTDQAVFAERSALLKQWA